MRWLRLITLAIALIAAGTAQAGFPAHVTDEELAILPGWCNHVQLARPPAGIRNEYPLYVARYGPSWTHIHHYCWALIDINRLNKIRALKEQGYACWKCALGNLDYVLRNTIEDPKFALRPEVMAHRIRLLTRYDSPQNAAQAAEQLIREWPALPDGYVLMARILILNNERDKAAEVLAAGDKAVEDKERYAKLKTTLPSK